MKRIDLNRRDFNKLTMAAFGGLVAGTTVGCSDEEAAPTSSTPVPSTPTGEGTAETTDEGTTEEEGKEETEVSLLMQEPHVCHGLNSCKNQGASKENDCAGQGTCASVASHDCGGLNACKGQGGCEDIPGQNTCKEMGKCHVPLKEDAWTKARAAFEAAMKSAGNEVGADPTKG